MASVVSVVQAKDLTEAGVREAVSHAIDLTGFQFPQNLASIVLKVNLRYYWDSSTGETTDPRVVSAVIDHIRDRCNEDLKIKIAEADASAMRTKHAFKMLGYEKLALKKSVELVNLTECARVEKEVVVNGKRLILPFAQLMLDADLLVNIPKLRTHRLTTVSCGLKNLFGAIPKPRKIVYHPLLDEVIVGVNKVIKPDLAIVDGLVALGRLPVKMGLVLASEDQLAADVVAARVMGYDPNRIRHLVMAEKEGVGKTEGLQIVGARDLTEFTKIFSHENYFLYNLSWNLQLTVLDAYLRMTGDTRPPVLDRRRSIKKKSRP